MKKVLSLMMMLMLAIGAWAGEVTFTPGTVSGSTTDTSADEMTSGGITFSSTSAALARTDNYRFYGSGTTTVTSTVGNITKIVFTCNNENYASTMSDASFSAGSVTSSENIVTWTGDASSFTFKPSAQVRVDLIVVTYTEGTAPAVATPVIAGETPFTESTEVTITCATDGASIYYTTDGSEPTSQSTAYTAAFSITETTTVKAIAYDATGAASSVATKTFEKEEGPASCATVAEINALADNTEFTFTGRLVVSGHAHATSNNWLYAQDETGGTLMFKATQDYQKDDVIPAGFTGTKATYGGVPQVKNLANMQPATETEELVAEELTPSQISSENVYRYAVIKGATVNDNNIVVGEESVVIYNNRFNTEIPADEKTYDVYGITSSFNGTPQFMPLEFVEVVEKTETPTIACLEGETEYTFIVNGLGELKLYANGVEVEIPYIVTRTSEDQVITLVATAQEEGKEISDPREWTVTVPKLEVVEIEELYVVGDFNGWSTTEGVVELVENESNEFVGTVEFEANGEFKLITPNPDVTATTGWIWFGGQDDNGVDYFEINEGLLDHEISLVNGANFRVVDAGEYTITVKEAAVVPGGKGVQEPLVMIVTKNAPQAIETIGSENVSAVRYYNLQGVESATPFEGVNIVVRMMNDGTKSVSKMVK